MNIVTITARFFAPACLALVMTANVPAAAMPHAHAGTGSSIASPAIATLGHDVSLAPRFESTAGSWVKIYSPRTGIGIWIDSTDYSNVVIGFGKDRAKELDNLTNYKAYANLLDAASVFGQPSWALYFLRQQNYSWVRAGKKVGLWVHVHVPSSLWTMRSFTVLGIVQRPVNAQTPPSAWLD